KAIIDKARERLKDPSYGGYCFVEENDQLKEKILERYEKLEKEKRKDEQVIAQLQHDPAATTIGPALEKILKRYVDDLDKLKVSGLQIFQVGYVWERGREKMPQIRSRLLVNDGELEELIGCLNRLETKKPNQSIKE